MSAKKASKPEAGAWVAVVGLSQGELRAEPGEVVPFEVPRWCIAQGLVRPAKEED